MDRIPYIFEIDSFELMPGVPPSEENLRPLWEHLCRETATCAYEVGDERQCIKFEQTSCLLSVLVEAENPQGRKLMANGMFDLTLNGFAEALPWAKDKIKNGARYEQRQKQIINKMMKSYLNIGWQTWRGYMVAANTALGLKGNEQKQRHIKLLFAQLEKLTAYLKKQQVEVEVMRESVQLQAQAARRVLAKRESIISELGDGIAIALEEVTPPPISECELKEPVLRA